MNKKYWSPRIGRITPYVPGEQPKEGSWIKLNTNENPYPPSQRVLEAIQAAAGERLRRYPDPECTVLRQAVARRYGLTAQQVFAGNGSDEVLAFCFQAFFDPDKPIVFPDITYSFYPVYADFFGLTYCRVPLDQDFGLPVQGLFGSQGGVVLANPNAPTGKAVGLDTIRAILEHNPDVVVLVDEAYVDFGASSAVPLIQEYPNLVVVQTLSKSRALAGLRVGFAMGSPDLMEALRCVRDSINSYTLDALALAGGAAALEDVAWFEETTAKIMATREWTKKRLEGLGFEIPPSSANFILARHEKQPAKELLDGLRARGILVRWFDQPRVRDYLRITIGTDNEMELLCQALEELVQTN